MNNLLATCLLITASCMWWCTEAGSDITKMNFLKTNDDDECRRHNNEGVCEIDENGHYTCACLYHEKPAFSKSEWMEKRQVRQFSHKCERILLDYHEDTCKVLLGNPDRTDNWEFLCPNNGFFQTWGAFAPEKGSYHVRLWYRCCNVRCPKWNCMWTDPSFAQKEFELPLVGVYVQGVKAKYIHNMKDSSWQLQLCTCENSDVRDEL